MPLDNVDKMILGLQPGESLAPSQGCERLSSNDICTVRASDEESVVEGEYDRPGVSGLGLSVVTGIGENCNPQGSSANFED